MRYISVVSAGLQNGAYIDVRMHRVLAQQVNTKLFARLGKSERSVESDNVREDPPTLVIMYHVKELQGHIPTWSVGELAEFRSTIIVVYPIVLVV